MYWITCLEGGPQRVNHASVTVGNKIYSFGGFFSDAAFNIEHRIDLHVFDTDELRWRPVQYKNENEAPKKCYGHTVVEYKRKVYLMGGRNTVSSSNTVHCFDTITSSWSLIPTKGCLSRKIDGHSACVVSHYMYVFGGFEQETEKLSSSVYRLNLISYEWEKINTKGTPPMGRDFHTASVVNEKIYIFGGRSMVGEEDDYNDVYSNDVMMLDIKSMKWEKLMCSGTPPCGRRSHSAAVYNNEIYIVGGFNGYNKHHLNDVYKFNPDQKIWYKMHPNGEPPCPRRRHCTCVVDDQMYLFGGSSPVDNEEYLRYFQSTDNTYYNVELQDHSDLYILDFFPSLRRLSLFQVIKSNLRTDTLPKPLVKEIRVLTTNSKMLRSFYERHPRNEFGGFSVSA